MRGHPLSRYTESDTPYFTKWYKGNRSCVCERVNWRPEEKGNEMAGCGHGECTVEGICKYDEQTRKANEAVRFPGVRWCPADLDRCEHGRHSIDSCFDCPNGNSSGNLFLARGPAQLGYSMRTREGRTEVRIGTMVRGEPIWVTVRDRARGADDGN